MAKTTIVHVELDTVDLMNIDFQTFLKEHEIRWVVVEEVGPAGGHPIVEYSGDYENIALMITKYWNDEDLFDEITSK